ncbi:MAG: hypothetical protein Q7V01_16655 [Vicinamibacterales bacterium]|nr:hypothetical protein [Vicinamibacterales bacterium]
MKHVTGHKVALGCLVLCSVGLIAWTFPSSFVPRSVEGQARQRAHLSRIATEERQQKEAEEAEQRWELAHPTCYECGKPATTKVRYYNPGHQQQGAFEVGFCDEHGQDPPASLPRDHERLNRQSFLTTIPGAVAGWLWVAWFGLALLMALAVPILLWACFSGDEPRFYLAMEAWLVLFVILVGVHAWHYLEDVTAFGAALLTAPGIAVLAWQKVMDIRES